ncbi:hypothetical protein ABPG72_019714 [Tetrahymena utriculariae]
MRIEVFKKKKDYREVKDIIYEINQINNLESIKHKQGFTMKYEDKFNSYYIQMRKYFSNKIFWCITSKIKICSDLKIQYFYQENVDNTFTASFLTNIEDLDYLNQIIESNKSNIIEVVIQKNDFIMHSYDNFEKIIFNLPKQNLQKQIEQVKNNFQNKQFEEKEFYKQLQIIKKQMDERKQNYESFKKGKGTYQEKTEKQIKFLKQIKKNNFILPKNDPQKQIQQQNQQKQPQTNQKNNAEQVALQKKNLIQHNSTQSQQSDNILQQQQNFPICEVEKESDIQNQSDILSQVNQESRIQEEEEQKNQRRPYQQKTDQSNQDQLQNKQRGIFNQKKTQIESAYKEQAIQKNIQDNILTRKQNNNINQSNQNQIQQSLDQIKQKNQANNNLEQDYKNVSQNIQTNQANRIQQQQFDESREKMASDRQIEIKTHFQMNKQEIQNQDLCQLDSEILKYLNKFSPGKKVYQFKDQLISPENSQTKLYHSVFLNREFQIKDINESCAEQQIYIFQISEDFLIKKDQHFFLRSNFKGFPILFIKNQ